MAAQHPPEWLDSLDATVPGDGDTGVENLRQIVRADVRATTAADKLRIDPSLARGLGYYTGAIMEINVKDLPAASPAAADTTT